jgi:dipeptidyl aminopeptidase/acylaminoacyl peptidase
MDSLHMAEKLYQIKHPYRLVIFEGADHGLTEFAPERRQLTDDWLDRYLRDKSLGPVSNLMGTDKKPSEMN